MGTDIKEKRVNGLEQISIPEGYFVITITGEIRIPYEKWYPEDDEVMTEGRYKEIPKELRGLQGDKLRIALSLL